MALLKGGKGIKDTTVSNFSKSELLFVSYGRVLVTPSRILSHGKRNIHTTKTFNNEKSKVCIRSGGRRRPEVSTSGSGKRSPQ